ncbi:AzlC family ABC transporter permease [Leptolyngbya sp. FACHB-541]|uniref:AzlC family ABC transporter permease n=1 Tax=Leptolyngbya sp. FACHB-541 TaxID=2692810 RepID=UPI001685593A|nr:AzlC family ABC transporter permease [Leptolyngbya sp. FACHB-541]MBD1996345.1 AzlC family ABC transporter permease [Leptolyngbya sp. FACHB-541]
MEASVTFDRAGLVAGIRQTIPIAIGIFAYGLVFGALSCQAGMSLGEALFMSSFVFAGASQFIAVELWQTPLPAITIIFTTLVINLRHILMGAALSPWFSRLGPWQAYGALFFLSDESWALTMGEFSKGHLNGAFLIGSGIVAFIAWTGSTLLGQTVGAALDDPAQWGLDFAFTAVFIALLVTLWRGKSDFLPWVVAAIVAIASSHWLPGNWYILSGGIIGSFVGALRHADYS